MGVPTPGGSQTVDRALEVLRQIVIEGEPLLLEELARRTQLSRSITFRLVRSLENAGYIQRDPRQGGYTVAATFLSMSVMTASRISVSRVVRPAMEAIVAEYGETVSFHIRGGAQRVCVDVAEGSHGVRRVIPVGETLPLFVGETGRVLLSDLPEAELRGFIEAAQATGLDPVQLRADLHRVREDGYIIGVGMRTPGVGSISVPVYGPAGIVGAMTVSGPVERWSPDAMSAAVPTVLNAVAAVIEGLGYQVDRTEHPV
jgi:IclR family acetate operon transcriptional repressor